MKHYIKKHKLSYDPLFHNIVMDELELELLLHKAILHGFNYAKECAEKYEVGEEHEKDINEILIEYTL